MAVQLPAEAAGTAVGVLIWSLLCLACSVLMFWLTWVHHERTSYVAIFAYLPGLATCASIAQQLHTIVRWRDIKTEQYHYSVAHIREPELAVAGPSTGPDLVLFYIQFYCYNAMSLLVLAWAASLTQSIYNVRYFKLHGYHGTLIAKITSILLPILFLCLLQVESVRRSTAAFIVIANILMAVGMAGAMLFLVAIVGRYVHSKITFTSWHFQYGSGAATRLTSSETSTPIAKRSIYDRWLLFRFTIGFFAMSAFQVFIIIFEITSARQNSSVELEDSPDLSAERAHNDFIQFMSGVSPGLLAFLVFGTTKALRAYMWEKLVPRVIKRFLNRHLWTKKETKAYELPPLAPV